MKIHFSDPLVSKTVSVSLVPEGFQMSGDVNGPLLVSPIVELSCALLLRPSQSVIMCHSVSSESLSLLTSQMPPVPAGDPISQGPMGLQVLQKCSAENEMTKVYPCQEAAGGDFF